MKEKEKSNVFASFSSCCNKRSNLFYIVFTSPQSSPKRRGATIHLLLLGEGVRGMRFILGN